MQWLVWTGGVVSMAGLAWLLSASEVAAGGPPLVVGIAAIALFVGGLILMAIGLSAGVGEE